MYPLTQCGQLWSRMARPAVIAASSALLSTAFLAGGCASTDNDHPAAVTPLSTTQPSDGSSARSSPSGGEEMSHITMAYPTGERKTSVLLIEKTSPRQIRLNKPANVTLKVTNLTDNPLNNVQLQEEQHGSFKVAAAGGIQTRNENGVQTYNLGELPPRQSKTIELTETADQPGQISSCLGVSFQPTLCSAAEVVQPQLRLTAQGPADSDICQPLIYRVTIANAGTGTEQGVQVQTQLPDGLQTVDGKNTVAFDVGALGPNQSKAYDLHLKPSRTGSFTTKAMATATGEDPAQSPEVTTKIHAPQLAVEVHGPSEDYVNKPVKYTIVVRNTGDAPAQDTILTLRGNDIAQLGGAELDGAQLAAAKENPGRNNLGTIDPGQTRTVTVTYMGSQAGQLHFDANASARCFNNGQGVSAGADTNIHTIPALLLSAVDREDPVRIGDNVYYTIVVQNQGSGDDHDVNVRAIIPNEQQYVSATGVTEPQVQGQVITFGTIPTLQAGKVVQWQVVTKALKAADTIFRVEAKSKSVTKPASKEEPTKLY